MQHKTIGLVLVLATNALGCASGDPVSIGDNRAKTGDSLSDYGAFWDGYIEASQFESGSDRVRIALDGSGHGYLEVGDQPLVSPPTDPNAAYPEDPNPPTLTPEPDRGLHEGFRYTIYDAKVEARRIRLSVVMKELYDAWCAIQTPVFNPDLPGGPAYDCVVRSPDGRGGVRNGKCYAGDADDEATRVEVPCVNQAYCQLSHLCSCTVDGCVVRDMPSQILDAALTADGNELTGTFIATGTLVHLVRD